MPRQKPVAKILATKSEPELLAKALEYRQALEALVKKFATYPAFFSAMFGSMPVAIIVGNLFRIAERSYTGRQVEPRVGTLMVAVITITQIIITLSARPTMMRALPNTVFAPLNRKPIEGLTSLTRHAGTLKKNALLEEIEKLRSETARLHQYDWAPLKLLLAVVAFMFIFLIFWSMFISSDEPSDLNLVILLLNALFSALVIGTVGGALLWQLEQLWNRWGIASSNQEKLNELNEILAPSSVMPGRAGAVQKSIAWFASNPESDVNIFGVEFSDDPQQKVIIEITSQDQTERLAISQVEYFQAVTKAMTELGAKMLVVGPKNIAMLASEISGSRGIVAWIRERVFQTTELLSSCSVSQIRKKVSGHLQRHSIAEQSAREILLDLNFNNKKHGVDYAWDYVFESGNTIFYLQLPIKSGYERFTDGLQQAYRNDYQALTSDDGLRIILINPKYMNFSQGESSKGFALFKVPSKKSAGKKSQGREERAFGIVIQRPQAAINFNYQSRQLCYDPRTFDELAADIRPLYKPWLPSNEALHFSYLHPEMLEQLGVVERNQVRNLLISGRVYGSGTFHGAKGGVGIVSAREAYRSAVTGNLVTSDYKIKTETNRYHGREVVHNGRYILVCFDGIAGHGH